MEVLAEEGNFLKSWYGRTVIEVKLQENVEIELGIKHREEISSAMVKISITNMIEELV